MKTHLVHLRRTREAILKNNFEVLTRAIRVVPKTVAELRLKFENPSGKCPFGTDSQYDSL
jgi:hypothetical protein